MPRGTQTQPGDPALGRALREIRDHLGLTQAMVADRSGVSLETYRMIEAGQGFPRLDTFWKACRTLGVREVKVGALGIEIHRVASSAMT